MNILEQAILWLSDQNLLDTTQHFTLFAVKTVTENIIEVELDGYGKFIRITADKIVYAIPGTRATLETNQHRFHVSNKYEVTK